MKSIIGIIGNSIVYIHDTTPDTNWTSVGGPSELYDNGALVYQLKKVNGSSGDAWGSGNEITNSKVPVQVSMNITSKGKINLVSKLADRSALHYMQNIFTTESLWFSSDEEICKVINGIVNTVPSSEHVREIVKMFKKRYTTGNLIRVWMIPKKKIVETILDDVSASNPVELNSHWKLVEYKPKVKVSKRKLKELETFDLDKLEQVGNI